MLYIITMLATGWNVLTILRQHWQQSELEFQKVPSAWLEMTWGTENSNNIKKIGVVYA